MSDRPTDRFSRTLNPGDLVIFPYAFDLFEAGRVEDNNEAPCFVTLRSLDGKETVTVQSINTIKVSGDDDNERSRHRKRKPVNDA
jgi:hypothetical protein